MLFGSSKYYLQIKSGFYQKIQASMEQRNVQYRGLQYVTEMGML